MGRRAAAAPPNMLSVQIQVHWQIFCGKCRSQTCQKIDWNNPFALQVPKFASWSKPGVADGLENTPLPTCRYNTCTHLHRDQCVLRKPKLRDIPSVADPLQAGAGLGWITLSPDCRSLANSGLDRFRFCFSAHFKKCLKDENDLSKKKRPFRGPPGLPWEGVVGGWPRTPSGQRDLPQALKL